MEDEKERGRDRNWKRNEREVQRTSANFKGQWIHINTFDVAGSLQTEGDNLSLWCTAQIEQCLKPPKTLQLVLKHIHRQTHLSSTFITLTGKGIQDISVKQGQGVRLECWYLSYSLSPFSTDKRLNIWPVVQTNCCLKGKLSHAFPTERLNCLDDSVSALNALGWLRIKIYFYVQCRVGQKYRYS